MLWQLWRRTASLVQRQWINVDEDGVRTSTTSNYLVCSFIYIIKFVLPGEHRVERACATGTPCIATRRQTDVRRTTYINTWWKHANEVHLRAGRATTNAARYGVVTASTRARFPVCTCGKKLQNSRRARLVNRCAAVARDRDDDSRFGNSAHWSSRRRGGGNVWWAPRARELPTGPKHSAKQVAMSSRGLSSATIYRVRGRFRCYDVKVYYVRRYIVGTSWYSF